MARRPADRRRQPGSPRMEVRTWTENQAAMETGTFLGEFPYVRIGSGPENLVILPGITLENEPPNRIAAWTYRLGFGRFARDYTVYVINRRRGMPPGYTTQDMAAGLRRGAGTGARTLAHHGFLHRGRDRPVRGHRPSRIGPEPDPRRQRLPPVGGGARDLRALAGAGTRGTLARAAGGHGLRHGEQRDEQTPRQGIREGLREVRRSRCRPIPQDFLTTLEADLDHDTTGSWARSPRRPSS